MDEASLHAPFSQPPEPHSTGSLCTSTGMGGRVCGAWCSTSLMRRGIFPRKDTKTGGRYAGWSIEEAPKAAPLFSPHSPTANPLQPRTCQVTVTAPLGTWAPSLCTSSPLLEKPSSASVCPVTHALVARSPGVQGWTERMDGPTVQASFGSQGPRLRYSYVVDGKVIEHIVL